MSDVQLSRTPDAFLIVLTIICSLVLAMTTRACLSYYGDVQVCLYPLKIVSKRDQIKNAVSFLQSVDTLRRYDHMRTIVGGKSRLQAIRSLKPEVCCRVVNKGWIGEEKITLLSVFFGKLSTGVDTGIPNPFAEFGHRYSNIAVPMNICGAVHHATP